MSNDEWTTFDVQDELVIRNDAPDDAKESYMKFLAQKELTIKEGSL